uniref:Core-binding (CB) domain-containing protein n=1 Tax=Amphimedon queenslandica TaxID=400682 RepID=A0A1X7UF04_AMPQE
MEVPALVCISSLNGSRLATPDTNSTLNPIEPSTSRVEHIRQRLDGQGLSSQATELILSSWRTKTNKSYDSLFGQWSRWCSQRETDPFSGPEGYQYNSIGAYRSAISSVHDKVDGVPVGQHPLVTRLIKGIFNNRPPIPRYSSTWDVQTVLRYLESLGPSTNLSLKLLSLKTVFLMAITRPSRSVDLAHLI